MLLLYRPGSASDTNDFFTDLSDVLDLLVTFADPVIIAGDVNVRLNRVDESPAHHFNELVAERTTACRVT